MKGTLIKLGFHVLFSASVLVLNNACTANIVRCSNDWHITGYYTPVEEDYTTKERRTVKVKGVGKQSFNKDFIRQVQIEGWGKTKKGWYLGYYSRAWHKSHAPLDANGNELEVGTIATDPNVIASGKPVVIASLYKYIKRKRFIAKDVGRNIRRRRIDVYTGEGHAAKQIAYRLTKQNQRICM